MKNGTSLNTAQSRRPKWLLKKIDFGASRATTGLLKELALNTVCVQAKCPNLSECFKKKHVTFLILGKYCSRHCHFCNVENQAPEPVDLDEPRRIALALQKLGSDYTVITSVTRDDLTDGGSTMFAETTKAINRLLPNKITIELLIPDFKANTKDIKTVVESQPSIIGHNLETVPRLYSLRPQADYKRSLTVLKTIKEIDEKTHTKSSLMLGLGEKEEEVMEVLEDLRRVDCDFLTLGQYLRPSFKNTEVHTYLPPEKFADYKKKALSLGFKHVESSPYTRTSYR